MLSANLFEINVPHGSIIIAVMVMFVSEILSFFLLVPLLVVLLTQPGASNGLPSQPSDPPTSPFIHLELHQESLVLHARQQHPLSTCLLSSAQPLFPMGPTYFTLISQAELRGISTLLGLFIFHF